MKTILTLTFLFISLSFFAQDPPPEVLTPIVMDYNWVENPAYHVNASDTNELIAVKDKKIIEYFFEKEGLVEYVVKHKVLWLNSDQAIEDNNKIYLPYSASSKLVINKARVITKEGKVIELSEDKILTAKDEETGEVYKYFTFEGVEKGSFVEYLYTLKKTPSYKGKKIDLQTTTPRFNISFDLYAPNNLIFAFKSYNGLPDVTKDTIIEDRRHWSVKVDSMPALISESQCAYSAQKQFLIYKLDRNTYSNTRDISSYANVSEDAYEFIYLSTSKAGNKKIKKILKEIDIDESWSDDKKIRAVEDYVKKTVFEIEGSNPKFSDVEFIVDNHFADEIGFMRLYTGIFKELGIKTQLVLTTDRFLLKFDKDFEAYNFLMEYLIYFPSTKSLMSPTNIGSRLNFPPTELINNYGLFIKEVTLGDFTTGIGKIRFIKANDYKKNFDEIIIDVKFDEEDLIKTELNIKRTSAGYYAMNIQPYLDIVDDEVRTELIESEVKYFDEDMEIIEINSENATPEDFGIHPMIVEAKVSSEAFMEKAGNKYLFNVGGLIGPQAEMYHEKKRILPLESQFGRNYHRVITFTIPEGYAISNLDELNIEKSKEENGETLYSFKSSYTVDGNKVTVTCDEFYAVLVVAPEDFVAYTEVMNSAADFNKVNLVFSFSASRLLD